MALSIGPRFPFGQSEVKRENKDPRLRWTGPVSFTRAREPQGKNKEIECEREREGRVVDPSCG